MLVARQVRHRLLAVDLVVDLVAVAVAGEGVERRAREGSSSQPPPASASMVGSEDEDLELPRASKVFHSITYGKE